MASVTSSYTESRCSKDNAALLLIDHQTGTMQLCPKTDPGGGTRDRLSWVESGPRRASPASKRQHVTLTFGWPSRRLRYVAPFAAVATHWQTTLVDLEPVFLSHLPTLTDPDLRLSCADRAAITVVGTVLGITATLATPVAREHARRGNCRCIRSRCSARRLWAGEIVHSHPFPYFGIIEHCAWHANLQH
jgi:hypothetical protein